MSRLYCFNNISNREAIVQQLLTNGVGDDYIVVGSVRPEDDVWRVRHVRSQQVYLLQRFAEPSPGLVRLLNHQGTQFPGVLDSWVDRGQVFLVLESVAGQDLDAQTLPYRLSRRWRRQRDLVLQALGETLGLRTCSPGSLCLTADGCLRLRWFPTETARSARAA